MSFTRKEKAFCVLEFDKNNSWTCVQRKFWTVFSSSHQTDIPYRNGTRNLRRRDVCAARKELPHHRQLKPSKEFKTSSSGAPGNQSEELVVNFRCLQGRFGEW